ncbi:hypothetical protein CFP56_043535 [Quercus suber]|uniref:Uncharacterized protein n=1 Tax=Quercus suber TaxID=58331 RepID=A0AAW0LGY0_QUESU
MLWGANLLVKNANETFEDSGNLSRTSLVHFISIRRQFGLCQSIVGGIKKDIRHASLDEVLELWRSCTKSKTMSQAFFPAPPSNLKHHTTQSYEHWWNSMHGTYLKDGIASLISITHPPLPRTKTGQINHEKNDNGRGIQLSNDHITRVVPESVTDKAQFVKPQDVIVKLKMSPFKAFLVEGPLGVCMASNEKMDSYLKKGSESSDKECYWRRAKKKLKLIAPSEPDLVEGTSYAFEHIEVAADQPGQQAINTVNSDKVTSIDSETSISSPRPIAVSVGNVTQMPSTKFMERTVSSDIPEDSVYHAEDVILRNRIDLALNLWKSLQQRIARTPFKKAPSLMREAQKIFDAIAANKAMDPSPLQSLVADYFEKAKSFELLQSSFSTSVMSEQRDKQLADCNFRLAEQSTIKNELIACGETLSDGLRNRIDLALNLWKSLQQRIARTPFKKAPSLMREAQKIFDAIAANKAMDPSPLQSLVADYFEKAKSFELLQSSFSTSVMSEQRDKQLADCNFRLAEQSTIKNELIACGETLSDGLTSVEAKTVELQEELEHLSNRKKDFKASILNNDEKLSNQSSIISSIQDEALIHHLFPNRPTTLTGNQFCVSTFTVPAISTIINVISQHSRIRDIVESNINLLNMCLEFLIVQENFR